MRIVTWNLRSATKDSPAWDYFLELAPDLALLQDVVSVSEEVLRLFKCVMRSAAGKEGRSQKFSTCLLVRGSVGQAIPLTSEWNWVNSELQRFSGNLISHFVEVDKGPGLRALSVYCPAWQVDPSRLAGVDSRELEFVRGQFGGDLCVTELLWAALRKEDLHDKIPWVVGGDFNLSETFDTKWPKGPHGCKEFLDRMANLGLVECLRYSNKKPIPTFKPSRGKVEDQIDHLFVSGVLLDRLVSCKVGDAGRVFGSLSDHLPIVADFRT